MILQTQQLSVLQCARHHVCNSSQPCRLSRSWGECVFERTPKPEMYHDCVVPRRLQRRLGAHTRQQWYTSGPRLFNSGSALMLRRPYPHRSVKSYCTSLRRLYLRRSLSRNLVVEARVDLELLLFISYIKHTNANSLPICRYSSFALSVEIFSTSSFVLLLSFESLFFVHNTSLTRSTR